MYYFEKIVSSTDQQYPISFSREWRYFDFREFIVHKTNRKKFDEWINDFGPGIPDFLASVVAQIHYRNALSVEFVERGVKYCRSLVEELGYERTSPSEFSTKNPPAHVILVAGCQGDKVRDARVKAAHRVVRRLSRDANVKVVFSGRNPGEDAERDYILTHNEAQDMEREFDSLVEEDALFSEHRNYSVDKERAARSSSENLSNFFQKNFPHQYQNTFLYIVSSTFHLRTLAEEAEKYISENEMDTKIERIILVGAEQSSKEEPIMLEQYYVKNMFFEIFRHMLRERPIQIEREGEYEGIV